MSDNITREPYRNAWYKQLQDAVEKHDEDITKMTPHLVPDVEEGDNGKILIAGEDGAFDWGQPPEELPIITEGDEGKVLKVDEGVPKWLDDTDSECLLVTITRSGTSPNYTYSADKTYAEIKPYADKGRVIANYSGVIAHVGASLGAYIQFVTPSTFQDHGQQVANVTSEIATDRINVQMILIYSDNRVERYVLHGYVNYLINITDNTAVSADAYKFITKINVVGIIPILQYTLSNDKIMLLPSYYDGTNYYFTNHVYGIKATVGTDKVVHITQIPKLPTATSADEGKVIMVDSNGDYVLGTVSGNSYPIPYGIIQTNVNFEGGAV